MNTSNINLIKTNTGMPEFLLPLVHKFRNFSIFLLFCVVTAGLFAVSGYIILSVRGQALERRKTQLLARLSEQKTKETLYLAIKSRYRVVEETLASNHAKSVLIANAVGIASPPYLVSLSENEKNRILMNFQAGSIEEAIAYADNVADLFAQNLISDVVLSSLSVDRTGITVSFEYSPVWE